MTAATLYMDAVITPNRSLSRKGLYALLSIFGVFNLMAAIFMLVVGAFPIPIFLGLDFAGVLLAFHINNKRARIAQRVRVSADLVEVLREADGQAQILWSSPTAFTQVSFDPDERRGPYLRIKRAGQAMMLAQSLGPAERTDFAQALDTAIRKARAERYAV
jgi:uncharacterized membrane protein